jgi:hypothetical protein
MSREVHGLQQRHCSGGRRTAFCRPRTVQGISWIKGLQIVNGGQTTATIFFAKRKYSEIDLASVFVPAKIIVMNDQDEARRRLSSLTSHGTRTVRTQYASRTSRRTSRSMSRSNGCLCRCTARMVYRVGSTSVPRKLQHDAVPRGHHAKPAQGPEGGNPSRRITKTDLAKYINAWDQKPDLVSMGSQKN